MPFIELGHHKLLENYVHMANEDICTKTLKCPTGSEPHGRHRALEVQRTTI